MDRETEEKLNKLAAFAELPHTSLAEAIDALTVEIRAADHNDAALMLLLSLMGLQAADMAKRVCLARNIQKEEMKKLAEAVLTMTMALVEKKEQAVATRH